MKTLILIDVQRDFMPGDPLGVPKGNEIIPIINRLIPQFDHVLATQDWHPPHHFSFASTHHKKPGDVIREGGVEQTLWPDHCIQNTPGADFAEGLHTEAIEKVFYKGTDIDIDSYSAFFDNARKKQTGLAQYLQSQGIKELYFAGLATDYCVLFSVLDALDLGFGVWVIQEACRAIDLKPGDGQKALEKMCSLGAKLV